MVAKTNKKAMGEISSKALYKLLKENLEDNALYVGISYVPDSEWNIYSSSLDSESTFYGGVDSDYDYFDKTFYNQSMYSMHKALGGGLSRVIKRSDWTYGVIYDSFPGFKNNFYVISKSYESGYARLNVYICLFSPGTASTVSPTGSSSSAVKYTDGYVWKYIYTITNSQSIRFLNSKWMPVPERIPSSEFENITVDSANYQQYIVQTGATAGEVYSVNIDSETLQSYINSDSDFRVKFNDTSVSLIGRDVKSNEPTKYFRFNLHRDSGTGSFFTSFTDNGSGYVGPITIGYDSESPIVSGLSAVVAPGSGFGSNIPSELGAKDIMVSIRNIPEEDEIIYNGSLYNLITLQLDPVEVSSNSLADKQIYVTCNYFDVDSNLTWKVGDRFVSKFNTNSPRGLVVAVKGNRVFYTIPQKGRAYESFADSEVLQLESGAKENTIKKHYPRETVFDSGNILVANYKDSTITRTQNQIEAFNFILNF